jgi:hypothetical protein
MATGRVSSVSSYPQQVTLVSAGPLSFPASPDLAFPRDNSKTVDRADKRGSAVLQEQRTRDEVRGTLLLAYAQKNGREQPALYVSF